MNECSVCTPDKSCRSLGSSPAAPAKLRRSLLAASAWPPRDSRPTWGSQKMNSHHNKTNITSHYVLLSIHTRAMYSLHCIYCQRKAQNMQDHHLTHQYVDETSDWTKRRESAISLFSYYGVIFSECWLFFRRASMLGTLQPSG